MREIKFRAWCPSADRMFKCYGFNQITKKIFVDCNSDIRPEGWIEDFLNSFILMQYTGLKDKNGKEIYEGDVVVKEGYIWFDEGKQNYVGTVEWIYSQWQVIAHCVNKSKQGISDGINEGINDDGIEEGEKSDWEIIGNIYENSELLKEVK